MKTLHEELKEIRLKKGISLEKISEITKIRLDFLERIEEGDYSVTPEPFVRAFLREYAEVVDIDPHLAMLKLDNKVSTIHPQKPVEHPSEEPCDEPPEESTENKQDASDEPDEQVQGKNNPSGGSEDCESAHITEKQASEAIDDTADAEMTDPDKQEGQTTFLSELENRQPVQRSKRKISMASPKKKKDMPEK